MGILIDAVKRFEARKKKDIIELSFNAILEDDWQKYVRAMQIEGVATIKNDSLGYTYIDTLNDRNKS